MSPPRLLLREENGEVQMSREQYDRLPRKNYSTVKLIGKSPAHYLHRITHGGTDSNPRKLGRAIHVATLEPEKFRAEFVEYPGRRDGKAWEAFQAANAGREIVTTKEMAAALRISALVRSNPMAAPYLSKGRAEVTLLWDHVVAPVAGLPGFTMPMKARPDFISDFGGGCMVDLKSTRDASPGPFGADAARYQYHVQAAIYVDGYRAITGKELPYLLVAVESEAPSVSQVYRVTEEQLELGRETYHDWLNRLAYCQRENVWPGYAEAPMDLVLPRWAAPADDDGADALDLDFPESQPAV